MARNPKPKKIEPAPQVLSFSMVNSGRNYIDLSRAASAVNRRFYRQGLNWSVSHITFTLVGAGTGSVTVSKVPNTWMAAGGWRKAFDAWDRQQMEAMKEAGAESAIARFRDFKVFLDTAMVNAPTQTSYNAPASGEILVPHDFQTTAALVTEGEWEYSEIVIPNQQPDASGSVVDPQEYLLHMVGINNNAGISRGIIEGYADSRAFPQSPDPVSNAIASDNNWMRDMFNVGKDNPQVTENASDRNDDLPYDQINYPGGENNFSGTEIVGYSFLNNGASTGIGQARVMGSNFPCGLIRLDSALSGGFLNVQVHMVPGHHRGYLAEPMQEM